MIAAAAATCLKKLEMVMVTGRNKSNAVPMSSAFQLSRLSGVPLFGRSIDDFRKLSYGEKLEPVDERFRSIQQQLNLNILRYKSELHQYNTQIKKNKTCKMPAINCDYSYDL